MEDLPELVQLNIASFLTPEDIQALSLTCKSINEVLPKFLIMKGPDFHIYGPGGGHFTPEPYFEGPTLKGPVKKMCISLKWRDQGWGNQKGDVFISLMRGKEEIAIKYKPLGIAPQKESTDSTVLLQNESIISEAKEGDHYRFTRNAGGGGRHELIVKDYKAIVHYQ